MKVILLKDIDNVGKKYEVKDVKSGYARNFLIPKDLVKIANKQNLKWLKNQLEIQEKQAEDNLKMAQDLASKLDGLEVAIKVKLGPEGQMFESITAAKVIEQLKEMGFVIKKSQVDLLEPIKGIGEFPLKIKLDHNLEVEITVIVSGEGGSEEV